MKKQSYTISDFYLFYSDNIEKDTVYDIDYKTYRLIIEQYLKSIANDVLENSKEFKLPCRLGTLSVIKKLPKNFDSKSLRIDFHETKIQNKIVYFVNEHSNYYKYRFYWSKRDSLITNKSKYLFVATRANKRRLALIVKNNEHDYIEIK